MMTVVCTECQSSYQSVTGGVVVASTMGRENELYQLWRADLYRCACGHEILAGFALRPFATRGDGKDMTALIAQEEARGRPVFYEREFPIEERA